MAIDLDAQLSRILNEYSDEVLDGMSQAGKEVANSALQKLHGAGPVRTGEYNRGWKVKENCQKHCAVCPTSFTIRSAIA